MYRLILCIALIGVASVSGAREKTNLHHAPTETLAAIACKKDGKAYYVRINPEWVACVDTPVGVPHDLRAVDVADVLARRP